MGQATLVDRRIDEARKLVASLGREGRVSVSAAYWIEDLEDQEWTLQIVAPTLDEEGLRPLYLAIFAALEGHPEIDLDADDIRPERADDPVVVEILDFLRRYPASEAFRLRGAFLKGHFVQRAYIYPIVLDGEAGPGRKGDSPIVG